MKKPRPSQQEAGKKIYSGPSTVPSTVQQNLDVSHKFALLYWFGGFGVCWLVGWVLFC